MRLFGFLFKKRAQPETKEPKPTTSPTPETKPVVYNSFSASPELVNLLWFGDGPKKNYERKTSKQVFSVNGITFTVEVSGSEEPSLIYTALPVQTEGLDLSKISRPPYFPRYSILTPEQKGVYWMFLKDPYSGRYDIGYVFILYYGLERQLLEGDFESAFKVILKLRDVYKNNSFQFYSSCALILTCLARQRADLANLFYASLDKEWEMNIPANLYFLCKLGLGYPLTNKDLMKYAGAFGFSNRRYIQEFPEEFLKEVSSEIVKQTGKDSIDLGEFLTQKELTSLPVMNLAIFANVSIHDKEIPVPLLCSSQKLHDLCFNILEQTHENIKSRAKELRDVSSKKEEPVLSGEEDKKQKPILSFDEASEKVLLDQYDRMPNAWARHFAALDLQNFYYKFRDLDAKYLKLCENWCLKDIRDLPAIERDFLAGNKAVGYLPDVHSLDVSIPAFERLAILYMKQNRLEECVNICNQAIEFYSKRGLVDSSEEFKNRKEKALAKLAKLQK